VTPDDTAAPPSDGWRCAVLGSPISHSLSPALHRAAYAELGLTGWTYDRFEVTEGELADFVTGCTGNWRGLSLTMPLKSAALELGEVDPLARFAGSANTLIFDGLRRLLYNTDIGGLVWAVQQVRAARLLQVTILGSGATARSSVLSAAHLGARKGFPRGGRQSGQRQVAVFRHGELRHRRDEIRHHRKRVQEDRAGIPELVPVPSGPL
jgi:shikimate dehydrogenase